MTHLRILKCRVLLLVMTIFIVVTLMYISLSSSAPEMDLNEGVDLSKTVASDPKQVCQQPKLKLYPNVQFRRFFVNVEKPNCGKIDWVYTQNGTIRYDQNIARKYGGFHCTMRMLERETDFKTGRGKIMPIVDGQRLADDFAFVSCVAPKGNHKFHNHLATIVAQKPKFDTTMKRPNALDMNVLMFGFDSVSHMSWQRKLPQTYRYLTQALQAVLLKGYNVVGDGTPAALLPILTGKTENELPNADKGRGSDAKPVDGHPFIWQNFSRNGYVTQFSEDGASYSTFNYRMLGFDKQPTDHYMRTFYLDMEGALGYSRCMGAKLRHNVMLDWIRDLYIAYPKTRRKFTFGFHNQLSHDDNNPLSIADDDFKNFLKWMNNKGHLDNTLMIVMSDHGARFQKLRKTVQGNFEERNPFFSIRVPPWFKRKYPDQYAALAANSERLTTPFDVHELLKSVLDFRPQKQGDLTKRGINLFSTIPAQRTCQHANIEPHWCACLKRQIMKTTDPIIVKCAAEFMQFLNQILPPKFCHRLHLETIFGATRIDSNPDFTDSEDREEYYQLSVRTQPGNAEYEFTVRHSTGPDKIHINARSISRINMYGTISACIGNTFPNLRPYCVCFK